MAEVKRSMMLLALSPEVAAIAEVMERRLSEKDPGRGRGGWRQATPESLLDDLLEQLCGLKAAHVPGDPAEIVKKAADVANLAMMVADRGGALDGARPAPPQDLPDIIAAAIHDFRGEEAREGRDPFNWEDNEALADIVDRMTHQIYAAIGGRLTAPEAPQDVEAVADALAAKRVPDMHDMVQAFHEKFGVLAGHAPAEPPMDTRRLRLDLILEESEELATAMGAGSYLVNMIHEARVWLRHPEDAPWAEHGDMPQIADGLADLVYVVLGTAISYGIDLRPVYEAVHAANMAKVGGPTRSDGKLLKPEGWQAPDVAGVLKAQGWEG